VSTTEEQKIRVLVVDDSSVMRRIIATALGKHPQIEIAGYAFNGLQAIEAVRLLKPDITTLDIEMPEMDGLSALKEIRKESKRMPIIMFSTLTHRGAQAAVMALTAGATDYVGKPTTGMGSMDEAFKVLESELIPKIFGLAKRARRREPEAAPDKGADTAPRPGTLASGPAGFQVAPAPLRRTTASAVVIGVSTGGPMALKQIFSEFSAPLPVPVFIVQHMPPAFTTLLSARLTASSVMTFKEPQHGEVPEAGMVYLAPGGQHMALTSVGGKVVIQLSSAPPENSCRPAVDVLFRTAAEAYGSSLLALILTGMGYDGLKGCQDVKARNGQILAQDEESSVIWGMPGAIVQNQLAEMVLPLDKIADEIVFRTRRVPMARPGTASND
jgi:two-component system chemotaxis response regulator CheB